MLKLFLVLLAVTAVLLLIRLRVRTKDPLRELVLMCRGDQARAQRLVAAEQAKDPRLTERQAARRAVLSWRRDLR